MPKWKNGQGVWSNEGFNIRHLVVTNFHFTQDGMTTILFVFRWYQIGHAVVHYYVSVFGMLSHWKPKYRRYVILCCLVVLIFYPWLNRGLPQTIVLSLPTSRIHLRITLFITCQDPLAEEVDLLLSHAKGFMFPEIRLYFFFVRTFWFSYHLWFKVFRLVTVYRPPPSKENVDSNAKAKQFCDLFFRLICHPLCKLTGTTSWNWSQRCEKAVCAVKCAITSAGALWPWVSYGIVGWRHSIWFGCRYNARLPQWKPSLHCLRVTNSERTQQAFSYSVRFVP